MSDLRQTESVYTQIRDMSHLFPKPGVQGPSSRRNQIQLVNDAAGNEPICLMEMNSHDYE